MNIKSIFVNWFKQIADGFVSIRIILSEKKLGLLLPPLLVAIIIPIGIDYFLADKLKASTSRFDSEIRRYEAVKQYSSEFTSHSTKFNAFGKFLPTYDEREDWLLTRLIEICGEFDIFIDQKKAQKEVMEGKILTATYNHILNMPFEHLGPLIARIENNPKYIKILNATITPDKSKLGNVNLDLEIGTIFMPSKEGGYGEDDSGFGSEMLIGGSSSRPSARRPGR